MAMIVAAVVKRNNRKALIAQLDALLRYPSVDRLPEEFNRPSLVLSGSEDFHVNPRDARLLADLCRARYEELADVGHSIPAEAPRRFERVVLDFLAQKQSVK
jgi:pimeloyl-ACP methyl ester carboxylesterase